MKIRLGDLRSLIVEALANPPGDWSYFHITHDDRGPTFTFTPRTPTWNAYTAAEDFTTPRVSLATSVEKAVHGKFGALEPSAFGQPEMFVYACRSVPRLVVPKMGDHLGSSSNPWGPDWSYKRYAIEHGLDPNDKEEHGRLVTGLISDDPRVTQEVWSLSPLKMTLVGRLWTAQSQSKIHKKWLLRPADDE